MKHNALMVAGVLAGVLAGAGRFAAGQTAGGNGKQGTTTVDASRAGDPNLPLTGADLAPRLNEDNINRVLISYLDPDNTKDPYVRFQYGGRGIARVIYLGYNGEGSWFLDRGSVYTFKLENNNVATITNRHLKLAQVPTGLKNATPTYLAAVRGRAAN